MPDRDSVLRGLAEISGYMLSKADIAAIGKGKEVFDSWYRAAEDARELIREQEPVGLIADFDKADGAWHSCCGNCYKRINTGDNYCRHCGRKVK